MKYQIMPYSYKQAKKLGVEIRPSRLTNKKVDVIRNNKVVASIGQKGYKDYPTYMEMERMGDTPRGTANKRRVLYKKRHNYQKKKGSAGWYADKILW